MELKNALNDNELNAINGGVVELFGESLDADGIYQLLTTLPQSVLMMTLSLSDENKDAIEHEYYAKYQTPLLPWNTTLPAWCLENKEQ